MTMNMRIKRAGINLCLMILAFTIQNCVFPLMPFLTATPNLLLILTFSFGFIEGKHQSTAGESPLSAVSAGLRGVWYRRAMA